MRYRVGGYLVILVFLLTACADDTPSALNVVNTIDPASLPPIPTVDVTTFAPAVKAQFEEHQKTLLSAPLDGRQNAKFARLLHAYAMYAPAANMYQRCIQLRPADLNCIYLHALLQRELGNEQLAITTLEER